MTRLYLPCTGNAPASPAFSAAWNVTSAAVRHAFTLAPSGSPVQNQSCGAAGSAGDNCLGSQYVSAPLPAGEVSGTVKGQIGAREATTGADARAQMRIWVATPAGAERGVLLDVHAEALSSEFATAAGHSNRKFPLAALSPATLTPVVAEAGDRLVVELGAKHDNASPAATLRLHDDQASDLPEDEATVSGSANPWIEFSGTFVFEAEAGGTARSGLALRLGL